MIGLVRGRERVCEWLSVSESVDEEENEVLFEQVLLSEWDRVIGWGWVSIVGEIESVCVWMWVTKW